MQILTVSLVFILGIAFLLGVSIKLVTDEPLLFIFLLIAVPIGLIVWGYGKIGNYVWIVIVCIATVITVGVKIFIKKLDEKEAEQEKREHRRKKNITPEEVKADDEKKRLEELDSKLRSLEWRAEEIKRHIENPRSKGTKKWAEEYRFIRETMESNEWEKIVAAYPERARKLIEFVAYMIKWMNS